MKPYVLDCQSYMTITLGSRSVSPDMCDEKDYESWCRYVERRAPNHFDIDWTDYKEGRTDKFACDCDRPCDCAEKARNYLDSLWDDFWGDLEAWPTESKL